MRIIVWRTDRAPFAFSLAVFLRFALLLSGKSGTVPDMKKWRKSIRMKI